MPGPHSEGSAEALTLTGTHRGQLVRVAWDEPSAGVGDAIRIRESHQGKAYIEG